MIPKHIKGARAIVYDGTCYRADDDTIAEALAGRPRRELRILCTEADADGTLTLTAEEAENMRIGEEHIAERKNEDGETPTVEVYEYDLDAHAVTVVEVNKPCALYLKYRSEINPQPCYLEIDPEAREISCDSDGEIGGAVPMDVWHRLRYRLRIPCLTAAAANELMHSETVQELARRIIDGQRPTWDGSNNVGRLTDDGQEALDELEQYIDRRDWCCDGDEISWTTARDWYQASHDDTREELGITAGTTDEDIAKLVKQEEACLDDTQIVEGIEEYLRELRDEVAEEKDE